MTVFTELFTVFYRGVTVRPHHARVTAYGETVRQDVEEAVHRVGNDEEAPQQGTQRHAETTLYGGG